MFILAALCLLAESCTGLVIDALAPVATQILGSRMPAKPSGALWLDRADCGGPVRTTDCW